MFENGYQYISFDVESLFSNVPIKRTVDIILKRIYEDKLVSTNLRKRTLKKLILDTCTKTAFSFNNKLYQQKDGVSMGSSLGPVLANIIMAELEDVVIKPLITNGTIKFYTRFVDDTLLVIKPENVKKVHNALNKFDKNLRFTVDMFKDKVPHFLDLDLSPDGTSIFRKDTNTGLYVNFTSFVPWTYRISWIKSLVTRASRICAPNKLSSEISTIKKFASWNDFPKSVVNSIINKTLNTPPNNESSNSINSNEITIYFRFPYYGDKGFSLFKSCIRKIKSNCKKDQPVTFRLLYDVTKLEFFCNTKDRTPKLNQSFVFYEFTCPGCNANYVGKTERTLHERCDEHAWNDKDSAVFNHLNECNGVQHMFDIGKLAPSLFTNNLIDHELDLRSTRINLVQMNTQIIDRHRNWNILLFKEAIKIKEIKPSLNISLKASKELQLF